MIDVILFWVVFIGGALYIGRIVYIRIKRTMRPLFGEDDE